MLFPISLAFVFFIQVGFGCQISNFACFCFQFICGFCIDSRNSRCTNTRYLVFSFCNFFVVINVYFQQISLFDKFISIRYFYINIFNLFFNILLFQLYCKLKVNPLVPGILLSIAFIFVTNLPYIVSVTTLFSTVLLSLLK